MPKRYAPANIPSSTKPPVVKGFAVGYTAPADLEPVVFRAGRPALRTPFALMLIDHTVAYGGSAAGLLALAMGGPLGPIGAVATSVIVARAQRGLECMVHEASHGMFTSKRVRRLRKRDSDRSVSDLLGNILAASPTFSTVESFRKSHIRHHGKFAVQRAEAYENRYDPDIYRSSRLDWHSLDWSKKRSFVAGVLTRLPRYNMDWFVQIGSGGRALINGVVWHGSVFAGLAIVLGVTEAAAISAMWAFAFAVVLPVLRFVAEAQEHDYNAGDTQFATTISNTGPLNWFLHPHGDGHHAEHHCFQHVPGYRLRRLAGLLADRDAEGWAALHLRRRRVIEVPTRGHVTENEEK